MVTLLVLEVNDRVTPPITPRAIMRAPTPVRAPTPPLDIEAPGCEAHTLGA
jgi:hypothetical protein